MKFGLAETAWIWSAMLMAFAIAGETGLIAGCCACAAVMRFSKEGDQ